MEFIKLFCLVFLACALATTPTVRAGFNLIVKQIGILLISIVVGFFAGLVWIVTKTQQEIARRRRAGLDPASRLAEEIKEKFSNHTYIMDESEPGIVGQARSGVGGFLTDGRYHDGKDIVEGATLELFRQDPATFQKTVDEHFKKKNRTLLYHMESESYFEVFSKDEAEKDLSSGLFSDVTGIARHEQDFKKQLSRRLLHHMESGALAEKFNAFEINEFIAGGEWADVTGHEHYELSFKKGQEEADKQLNLMAQDVGQQPETPLAPQTEVTVEMAEKKIGEIKDYEVFLKATDALSKARAELIGEDLTKKLVSIYSYASKLVTEQNNLNAQTAGGNSGT